MQVVVICERLDIAKGRPFRTIDSFDHTPMVFNRTIPGWDGTGAGLSDKDLKQVARIIATSARNIQSFQVFLAEET